MTKMTGGRLVYRLSPADPCQLDTTALHARIGKQHTTQRARTQVCKALKFSAQRCDGDDGTCINPGLTVTQQVHLPDYRQLTRFHTQHLCFINTRGSPDLRQHVHLEFPRAKPLQAQCQ